MDECGECGFHYDLGRATGVGDTIATQAGDVATLLLDGDDAALRQRRRPDVWSPLEYACHLRDVLLVQRERLLAARRRDTPSFEPMGRDERVDHDGYADQCPADVARQLEDAAGLFANVLARLGPDDWDRTGLYNYPEPTERSLRWIAVHTLHELHHHRLDIVSQMPHGGGS